MPLSTRKGINAQRRIVAPESAGVGAEIFDARNSQPSSTFLRAVVVRVINDTNDLTDEVIADLKSLVMNPGFVDRAPRNSIIVRVVSGGADRKGSQPVLCYPFLPSHMSLPVKTGEQVWVLYENPDVGGALPYWLWRISEPDHVEDVNYTHGDRRFTKPAGSEKASDKINKKPVNEDVGFPNGGETESTQTLSGEDDYENIISDDPSYDQFTPEPVPRFTKRPGDMVLQGSNNTLLVMGEARVGRPADVRGGTSSGTIDLVAGRGQNMPDPGVAPSGTAPATTRNTRGNLETEKDANRLGSKKNPQEGDPDIENDAARLLVSQQLEGDEFLGLSETKLPKPFRDEVKPAGRSSYTFLKADNVRVIAREDGSLFLVKEGDQTGNMAGLTVSPDGETRLDGNMIFIGRPGGAGPGPGGAEPYIKFSVYKKQLEDIIDQLNSLLNSFSAAFVVPVAAPGQPHPGLSTSGVTAITQVITKLNVIKRGIDQAKSTRIMGE